MSHPNLLAVESYDYDLPEDRIAQYPVTPRDAARLLVIHRKTETMEHSTFAGLGSFLKAGDLVVLNDTSVIPARILCEKGEVLLVRKVDSSTWDCLVFPGKHFKPGTVFPVGDSHAEVLKKSEIGRIIRFYGDVDALMMKHGRVPLPPYINRAPEAEDRERYQTIYAKHPGSIAAPTAGMHFTERVFADLTDRNIEVCKITLHVGPGTFRPVKASDVTQHKIDPEYYSCSTDVWEKIRTASRVIAVGTTTTRTLETIAARNELAGSTDLFIFPGHKFRIVQGMITNFHLPKSSLLLLVSAFAGYEKIRSAYKIALENNYRFYSYGDATLIL